MNTPEEQDDLWQLLGKAKKPVVSPFFARNVLREIRATQQAKTGMRAWFSTLSAHWRLISMGSVAALLLAVNAMQFLPQKPTVAEVKPSAQNAIAKTDYEVIKNLDELVAYEDHSIWLDDSTQ